VEADGVDRDIQQLGDLFIGLTGEKEAFDGLVFGGGRWRRQRMV
jgi:hypothetical protein